MGSVIPKSKPPIGALISAVCAKDEICVRKLLDDNADINEQYGWNLMTPLHWSTQLNLTKIAILLLNRDADIDMRSSIGSTPLHIAAGFASTVVVKLLLNKGALINEIDLNGDTPLHYAAYNNNIDNADVLIRAGANINMENYFGEIPILHTALSQLSNISSTIKNNI